MPDTKSVLRRAVDKGLAGARVNLVPALILQASAVALLLAYAFVPAVTRVLERVAELKETWGYAFSAVSTVCFGVVLPTLLGKLSKAPPQLSRRDWVFLLLFWAFVGVEIDAFYRLQGLLFGNTNSSATIAAKVAVDQLLFTPFWAIPLVIIVYRWKDRRPLPPVSRGRWKRSFVEEIVPVLLPNWAVWIPAVTIIYALPATLQLPMQNIVLCLWVLILTFIVGEREPEA